MCSFLQLSVSGVHNEIGTNVATFRLMGLVHDELIKFDSVVLELMFCASVRPYSPLPDPYSFRSTNV